MIGGRSPRSHTGRRRGVEVGYMQGGFVPWVKDWLNIVSSDVVDSGVAG